MTDRDHQLPPEPAPELSSDGHESEHLDLADVLRALGPYAREKILAEAEPPDQDFARRLREYLLRANVGDPSADDTAPDS